MEKDELLRKIFEDEDLKIEDNEELGVSPETNEDLIIEQCLKIKKNAVSKLLLAAFYSLKIRLNESDYLLKRDEIESLKHSDPTLYALKVKEYNNDEIVKKYNELKEDILSSLSEVKIELERKLKA